MIKDIVTLLDLNVEEPALSLSIDLAIKTNAHLTGLVPAVEPIFPGYVEGMGAVDILEIVRARCKDEADKAAKDFENRVALAGISAESRSFSLAAGGGIPTFTVHCQMTDVVVIRQDNPGEPQPMRAALIESALFDGCAPVILVPYIGAENFACDHIMVAWDGSRAAARAVHAALPILEMANKIDVVVVGDPPALAGEPGADIALYLARHGINVQINRVVPGSVDVSDVILNYVSDKGIDLAVMGGYGHSRLREFILGGTTRAILEAMTVPFLMTH